MTKLTNKKVVKEPTKAQIASEQLKTASDKVTDELQGTVAGEIWNEIKDREILMFALPNQTVSQHVLPIKVEPSKLYLRTASAAVLPSLETALGKKYVVELVDKFVVVSRAPLPLTQQ